MAILCFVFPTKVEGFLSGRITDNFIKKYREDPDLQNFIDFLQMEVRRRRFKLSKVFESYLFLLCGVLVSLLWAEFQKL